MGKTLPQHPSTPSSLISDEGADKPKTGETV